MRMRHSNVVVRRAALAITIGLLSSRTAWAEPSARNTPDAVVDRHIATFLARNWDQALLDYADDAVFMLPNGPLEGKKAIKGFFLSLDAQKPAPRFTASKASVSGDVAMEDWVMNAGQPGALKGRDVFIIREGKIRFQTTIGLGPAQP